jgi:hypothetical protein
VVKVVVYAVGCIVIEVMSYFRLDCCAVVVLGFDEREVGLWSLASVGFRSQDSWLQSGRGSRRASMGERMDRRCVCRDAEDATYR